MFRTAAVRRTLLGGVALLAVAVGVLTVAQADPSAGPPPTTPIKHVVVIFGENISFDHYFGTYPTATNPPGQPSFTAEGRDAGGRRTARAARRQPERGRSGAHRSLQARDLRPQPQLRRRAEGVQRRRDGQVRREHRRRQLRGQDDRHGLLRRQHRHGDVEPRAGLRDERPALRHRRSGRRRSARSTWSPATTHGVQPAGLGENGTMIFNSQPALDDCSASKGAGLATMSGRNIGDLMNAAGVTWGWFAGGFRPASWEPNGDAVCGGSQANAAGGVVSDYLPHHEPFQYYASTANRHHVPPSSVGAIGTTDEANHQYDLTRLRRRAGRRQPAAGLVPEGGLRRGRAPGLLRPARRAALRRARAQRAPAVAGVGLDRRLPGLRRLRRLVRPRLHHPAAGLRRPQRRAQRGRACAVPSPGPRRLRGRCGPGPRLPLLLVSPYAKQNFVDSTQTEQASITRFIEDNWNLGRIGDQSFDARAASLNNMFDFTPGSPRARRSCSSNATGQPLVGVPSHVAIAPSRPDPGPRPTPTRDAPTRDAPRHRRPPPPSRRSRR